MAKAKAGKTKASKEPKQPVAGTEAAFPSISTKSNLLVQQLKGSDIFTVAGVLTQEESARCIAAAEARGFEQQGSRGAAYGEAFRDNGRLAWQDPALAAHLWAASGLAALFAGLPLGARSAVGLNPNFRLYRYVKGQRFGRHVDDDVAVPGLGVTAYTLLVYLSGGLAGCGSEGRLLGGETEFYGARNRVVASCAPQAGLALLHRHGADCLEHAGLEVKSGVKYVLRSDVVYA